MYTVHLFRQWRRTDKFLTRTSSDMQVGKDNESVYYFTVKANNNRKICTGTGYNTKSAMVETIRKVFPDFPIIDHIRRTPRKRA